MSSICSSFTGPQKHLDAVIPMNNISLKHILITLYCFNLNKTYNIYVIQVHQSIFSGKTIVMDLKFFYRPLENNSDTDTI